MVAEEQERPEMVEPPPGQVWSARRLNALVDGLSARRYLEIGLAKGSTFSRVSAPDKTAVDPLLSPSIAALAGPEYTIEKTTSDEFFDRLAPEATFDLIYVDGLHTFEQVYRDLCSSLLHSHVRTAILIDDTRPIDVYSSLGDNRTASAERKRAGGEHDAWHGDVFKVVFAIHDFHLGLDYRTITGPGNPQTLVWRSRDTARGPRFESLEAISRLTYFDMLADFDAMQPASEADAISTCLESLGADLG